MEHLILQFIVSSCISQSSSESVVFFVTLWGTIFEEFLHNMLFQKYLIALLMQLSPCGLRDHITDMPCGKTESLVFKLSNCILFRKTNGSL